MAQYYHDCLSCGALYTYRDGEPTACPVCSGACGQEKETRLLITQRLPDGRIRQFVRTVVGTDGDRGVYVAPRADAHQNEWTYYRWADETVVVQPINDHGEVAPI